MKLPKFALTFICCFAVVGAANAQETSAKADKAVEVAGKILDATTEAETETDLESVLRLTEEGELVGKAVATPEDGEQSPVAAKVTLEKDGIILDSVDADEEGSFAFANIAPGTYQLYGSTGDFYGAQEVVVDSFAPASTCSSCQLDLAPAAPCQSCSALPAASCGTCGGGCGCGGGAGGGFFGGGGGGGLLSSRIVRLGAIGGIVAIATSDDDDDASPTN